MWLIALAVAVAGILATLTDWLFMGVLFHASYNRYPEVWRDRGGNERAAIMWSSLIGFVMSAGVSCLCILAGASTFPAALIVASLRSSQGPLSCSSST
ncbi:MAG: hypothetical protein JOZ55_06380, partial [Alphaproteobacteria bacterium]|nr:hypothetical protein [Alphaproteobacteria bacterium]